MTDIHQHSQDHDLVLPTYIGYHHWTKQLVKEKVERDPLIQKATVYDDKYRFCSNTIAIYNFENNPVFGKYKTVIIDYKKGFVLYKKATRSILRSYSTGTLLSGLYLQKFIARNIGLRCYHSISLIHLVFFSLQTYTKNNTDWVGLHFFQNFSVEDNTIKFLSIPLRGINYVFTFEHNNPLIHQRIRDSLMHNSCLSRKVHEYHSAVAWDCDKQAHETGSMIFNPNFLAKTRFLTYFTLKRIADEIGHDWICIYMKHVAEEYNLKCWNEDHKYFYSFLKRKHQNY